MHPDLVKQALIGKVGSTSYVPGHEILRDVTEVGKRQARGRAKVIQGLEEYDYTQTPEAKAAHTPALRKSVRKDAIATQREGQADLWSSKNRHDSAPGRYRELQDARGAGTRLDKKVSPGVNKLKSMRSAPKPVAPAMPAPKPVAPAMPAPNPVAPAMPAPTPKLKPTLNSGAPSLIGRGISKFKNLGPKGKLGVGAAALAGTLAVGYGAKKLYDRYASRPKKPVIKQANYTLLVQHDLVKQALIGKLKGLAGTMYSKLQGHAGTAREGAGKVYGKFREHAAGTARGVAKNITPGLKGSHGTAKGAINRHGGVMKAIRQGSSLDRSNVAKHLAAKYTPHALVGGTGLAVGTAYGAYKSRQPAQVGVANPVI